MEIRKLKPEEHVHYAGISHTVFYGDERIDIREMMKNPLDNQDKAEAERWGYFDNNHCLQSAVTAIPYTIRMNGKDVKMAGIGNVVTRPEYRGAGCVRQIFENVFAEMLEKEQVFSFLYPFSYAYYRKFGYEVGLSYNRWSFPPAQLARFPYPKNIAAHRPGDDIQPYAQIYRAFAKDRNWAVVRSQKNWDDLLARDPYKKLEFTFLVRDDLGNGIAYILYDCVKGEVGHVGTMEIKELCWATPEGFQQMLGFIGKLSPEVETVHWHSTPCDVNFHALCPDPYDVSLNVLSSGMGRIVDVQAGLQTLIAPTGSGRVYVDIVDKYWQTNAGTYAIEWESENLTVTKQPSASPDMSTSVETLAQLITGYLSANEAIYKTCTTMHGAYENLNALFPKKQLYLAERF